MSANIVVISALCEVMIALMHFAHDHEMGTMFAIVDDKDADVSAISSSFRSPRAFDLTTVEL